MPVAYYIATMEEKPKVYFHTGNYTAGERMADVAGVEHVRLPGHDEENP